jgi:chromosome segregation ATPase
MSIKEIIDRAAVPDWFLGTAAGRAMLSETESHKATERKKIAGRLAELRKEQAAVIPALAEAEAAALERVKAARESLKAAERQFGEALSKCFATSHNLSRQVEQLESELIESAPRELANFIQGAQDLITLRRLPSLNQKMIDEINETVASARALMLEPSIADLPKKLAALAARLPYLND